MAIDVEVLGLDDVVLLCLEHALLLQLLKIDLLLLEERDFESWVLLLITELLGDAVVLLGLLN